MTLYDVTPEAIARRKAAGMGPKKTKAQEDEALKDIIGRVQGVSVLVIGAVMIFCAFACFWLVRAAVLFLVID